MIIGNGFLTNKLPMTCMTGKMLMFNKTDKPFGLCAFDKTSSSPEGFGMKAIQKPRLGGSISAYMDFTVDNSGTLTSGINIESSNEIEFEISADANLVASMSSTNSIEFETSLQLSSGANISGLNTIELSTTALPTALVNVAGVNTIQFQQNGTISALAGLSTGESVETLTPALIWNYGDRTLTSSSSTGGLTVEQQAQLDAIEINTGNIATLM